MQKLTLRMRILGATLLAAAVLTACGGGGGDSTPAPTQSVTAIPENLAISAPVFAESATAVAFGNSAGTLSGLKYQWDFGDGSTSTLAAPSHSFAGGGEFDVVLKVTNEAGSSREVRTKVSITNVANVRGLECTGVSNAGWCWQNPRPTGNRVNTVFFLNGSTGWRGGDNGEIFKTTDSGTTWVRQNSGITASIYGIKFLDANTGWASGAYGAMLRTTDGGTTWTVAKFGDASSSSYEMGSITAIDAKTVYIGRPVGNNSYYYGSMFASQDGGATWRTVTTVPSLITPTGKFWSLQNNSVRVSTDGGQSYTNALDIKLPSSSYYTETMSLVARDDLRAAVHARAYSFDYTTYQQTYFESFNVTLDGGATWTKVEVQNVGTTTGVQRLFSISADGKTLIASGSGSNLKRSTDGGATWTALAGPTADYYYTTFVTLGGNDIAATAYNGLWLSEDNGQTWQKLNSSTDQGSYSITGESLRRVDATTLSATDSYGATYLSKDKGQTWTRVVAPVDSYYGQAGALAFSDAKNGFMTDAVGRSFTTKDGGATWEPKSTTFGAARAVQFVNKTTGWLVGAADNRLYKSTDAGQSWTPVPTASGVYYSDVYFANENLGLSQRTYGAQWAYTKDAGKTWTEMVLPSGVASMRFGEQAWVAVGGAGGVYVSIDSGSTWNARYTGTSSQMLAVAFSDAKTAWAVGSEGSLLKSEDSGTKWTLIKLPAGNITLRDIKFANAKVGWIVGDAGVILGTQDGGKTWNQQASGTSLTLYTVQVADSNTAWVMGANGLVLATGTGGN